MSLQTRLSALITSIGADIKALQTGKAIQVGSTAQQVISGNADTYLSGSLITFPAGKLQAGSVYRCRFNVVKTAAGTAAPSVGVKVGTAGTTADSTRATVTFAAQTAVIDEGEFEVVVNVRSVGAAAVLAAAGKLWHRLVTTGLNATATFTSVLNTGASFDSSTATKIGLVVNPGASGNFTINSVSTELVNLSL